MTSVENALHNLRAQRVLYMLDEPARQDLEARHRGTLMPYAMTHLYGSPASVDESVVEAATAIGLARVAENDIDQLVTL